MANNKKKRTLSCKIDPYIDLESNSHQHVADFLKNYCREVVFIKPNIQSRPFVSKTTLIIDKKAPYDINKMPYKDLFHEMIERDAPDFYYFCWRGAFDDSSVDMGEMPLKSFHYPETLKKATKKLERLGLMRLETKKDKIGEAKHSKDKYFVPERYHLTQKGKEVYERLKEWGFIKVLIELKLKNPNCFQEFERLRYCFKNNFQFVPNMKKSLLKEALKGFREDISLELPNDGDKIRDKNNERYFRIYYYHEWVNNRLEINGVECEFTCYICNKTTILNFTKEDILKRIDLAGYCINCENPTTQFITTHKFKTFKLKRLVKARVPERNENRSVRKKQQNHTISSPDITELQILEVFSKLSQKKEWNSGNILASNWKEYKECVQHIRKYSHYPEQEEMKLLEEIIAKLSNLVNKGYLGVKDKILFKLTKKGKEHLLVEKRLNS